MRTISTILEASLTADRRLTLASGALAIAGWVVIPFQAVAIKFFIDAIVNQNPQEGAVATVAAAVTMGSLWYFNNLRQFVQLTLQERTTHELDQRIQGLVGEFDGIEHLERTDDLDRIATLRVQGHWFANIGAIFELPALTLNVAISGILLASVDPILVLVPLAIAPSIWLSGQNERILQAAEKRAAPVRRLRNRMLEFTTDSAVAGEARLFNAGAELVARHAAADREINRILDRAAVVDVALSSLGWAVYALGFALMFVVVVNGIRAGQLGVGDLFVAFYLVRGLTWQAQYFLFSIVNFRRTIATTNGYLWLVDLAATARAARPADPLPMPAPGTLQFDGVTFRYPGTERDVLNAVTFSVPPGAVLAVVGDNGAGKTTLVKLLARFYPPTEGAISLNGSDISQVSVEEWRSGLTACFQDFCRFELLARETVGVGDLERIDDLATVHGAVDGAGADDVIDGLPNGLDTPLGASWGDGAELSVGQWQKLALARAVMRRAPRLLLLDEPTAALDATAEARLFERYAAASDFARATRSITIIVSHRMSTVRMADVIAVVEDGHLREVGTHAELLAADGLYRQLYTTQAAAYR